MGRKGDLVNRGLLKFRRKMSDCKGWLRGEMSVRNEIANDENFF